MAREGMAAAGSGLGQVEDIGEDWVEASMPFDTRTQALNGSRGLGALAVLAESVGSLAAAINVDRDKFVCLGQTLEVIHLNPAVAGPFKAKATPLMVEELDRQIWEIKVLDAASTPIANAKLSVVILPRTQLSA